MLKKITCAAALSLSFGGSVDGEEIKKSRTHAEEIAHTNARQHAYRAALRAKSRRQWSEIYQTEFALRQQEIQYLEALAALQRAQSSAKQSHTKAPESAHKGTEWKPYMRNNKTK
jgi:hypothetical protein